MEKICSGVCRNCQVVRVLRNGAGDEKQDNLRLSTLWELSDWGFADLVQRAQIRYIQYTNHPNASKIHLHCPVLIVRSGVVACSTRRSIVVVLGCVRVCAIPHGMRWLLTFLRSAANLFFFVWALIYVPMMKETTLKNGTQVCSGRNFWANASASGEVTQLIFITGRKPARTVAWTW